MKLHILPGVDRNVGREFRGSKTEPKKKGNGKKCPDLGGKGPFIIPDSASCDAPLNTRPEEGDGKYGWRAEGVNVLILELMY